MIDFRGERAVYQQLADLLREQIVSGRIRPGTLLPSSKRLEQEHGVSRETIRRALSVLRREGLIVTEPSYGTRVIERQQRQRISVPRGARIIGRMPTESERVELDIEAGAVVPVFEVWVGARMRGPYAADRFELTTA